MKRATVRTLHDDPGTVADAVRPDNTDEMTTVTTDDAVETTIERPTAAGLRTTTDDYLVNLSVADAVTGESAASTEPTDGQSTGRTDRATDDNRRVTEDRRATDDTHDNT